MCMASQAVYIEITHSLNSDSFIAPRQGIAHRGNMNVLYSDNGTNFVACENEQKKAYQEIVNEMIQSFVQSLEGDLMRRIRNPSAARYMGVIWVRQIRSARTILSSLLSTHGKSIDEESLLILVAETEGILNL